MSVRALGAAWRAQCAPLQKFLLLALADHANDETFDCWPSLTHLTKKTGMGRSTIARTLNALEAAGFIAREQREKTSTRYILNVSDWCQSGTSARAGLVPERDGGSARAGLHLVPERDHKHQSNHQGTVNQILEAKKARKEAPKQQSSRGSRLPADWALPAEWRQWAQQEHPGVDAAREADKFADYWRAKSGPGATKLDWQATWRNWVRNAKQAPTAQAASHGRWVV